MSRFLFMDTDRGWKYCNFVLPLKKITDSKDYQLLNPEKVEDLPDDFSQIEKLRIKLSEPNKTE